MRWGYYSRASFIGPGTVFVYLHFRYDRVTHKNDIALVKLQRPVVYRNGLKPACLPKKFIGYPLNSLRTKPTIIGWGKTGNNHPVSPHLKQVSVPLVDTGTCNSKYKKVGDGIKIDNTQICAGDDSSDSCSGDSGGPLLSSELDEGRWSVIGIVSFGAKGYCADSTFPGVYTRVDQFLDWIERNSFDT